MNKKKSQFLIIATVSVICFASMAKLGVDYSLHWLLTKQTFASALDWGHLIDSRIQQQIKLLGESGEAQVFDDEELDFLGTTTNVIFEVGNVTQIDFVNAVCHCHITFRKPTLEPPQGVLHGGEDTSHSHSHSHAVAQSMELRPSAEPHSTGLATGSDAKAISDPSAEMKRHVFNNTEKHLPSAHVDPDTIPMHAEHVSAVVADGKHRVFVPHVKLFGNDHVVAEALHAVKFNGEVRYLVRLLIDLEAEAARYTKILYLGVLFVFMLVVMSFAYPSVKYLRTSRRQRIADEKAHFLANHDVLTGVASRTALQNRAPKHLNACTTAAHEGVLLLVDVDNFKEINDFHGHHVGDLVIQEVANRLKQQVSSSSCIVSRLGGDEFAVLSCETHLKNYVGDGDIPMPSNFQVVLEDGLQVVDVAFSIGFARYPRDGTDLSELLRHADLALYTAKKDQKPGAREYDPVMGQVFRDRVNLLKSFREGLSASQIIPHYQPLMNRKTGQVSGMESLARWYHPTQGVLSASEFSIALEDGELCRMLGSEMLRQVTHDMGKWKKAGIPFGRVGLNVGAADLLRPGFILDVASHLAKNELNPQNLVIEVTETTLFGSNYRRLLCKLRELRQLGCCIALDDFGTGYSSITYLKELPYTAIKIDKSFIKNIAHDEVDQSIVKALVQLGKSIEYTIVAEGVETQDQCDAVSNLGCYIVQGYFYSTPLPACEIPSAIDRLNNASCQTQPGVSDMQDYVQRQRGAKRA